MSREGSLLIYRRGPAGDGSILIKLDIKAPRDCAGGRNCAPRRGRQPAAATALVFADRDAAFSGGLNPQAPVYSRELLIISNRQLFRGTNIYPRAVARAFSRVCARQCQLISKSNKGSTTALLAILHLNREDADN